MSQIPADISVKFRMTEYCIYHVSVECQWWRAGRRRETLMIVCWWKTVWNNATAAARAGTRLPCSSARHVSAGSIKVAILKSLILILFGMHIIMGLQANLALNF